MKNGILSIVFLSAIFFFVAILSSGSSALATTYTSLHDDLGSTDTNYGTNVTQKDGNFAPGSNNPLEHFKVFVPPGTYYIDVKIFCQNSSSLYTITKWGGAPSGYSIPSYSLMSNAPVWLDSVQDQVHFTKAGEGSILIISGGGRTINESEAAWMYVDIKGSGTVYAIKYIINFDKSIYSAWYSKIDWAQIEAQGGGVYYPGGNVAPPVNDDQSNNSGSEDYTGGSGGYTDGDDIFGGNEGGDNSGGGASSTDDAFTCALSGGTMVNGNCQYNNNTGGSGDSSDRYSSATSAITCMFLGGKWVNGACSGGGYTPPDNSNNNSGSNDNTDTGNSNPGYNDDIFGGNESDEYGDNKSNPTPNPTPTPVSPVLPISCGFSLQKAIKKADLNGRTIAVPQPSMTIPVGTMAVPMEFYAMVKVGEYSFLAVKDSFHPEIIGFVDFREGDRIRSYDEGLLVEGEWTCDVFAENLFDLNVPVDVLINNDVHFLVGYAPKGDVDKGLLQNLRYTDIWFSE